MSISSYSLVPIVSMYSLHFFDVFNRLTSDETNELALAAVQVTAENPLDKQLDGIPRYWLPHFGNCTAGQVITAMCAFIVWKMDGKGLPDSVLLHAARSSYELWKLSHTHKGGVQ